MVGLNPKKDTSNNHPIKNFKSFFPSKSPNLGFIPTFNICLKLLQKSQFQKKTFFPIVNPKHTFYLFKQFSIEFFGIYYEYGAHTLGLTNKIVKKNK